ncbi:17-beta-hydroxysteroid dehydrogenase type 6 [Aplysia californica]|uniref:17-beta-hydroxysteroid dehydrogenase type 6 n=1 Tax=Aplysia californica TaxID=6500 RepID=A0ABM1ABZ7_APLCA|nr:17-beta-hydroxysteroid dehydrogenase type 6 [Aplysia californica]
MLILFVMLFAFLGWLVHWFLRSLVVGDFDDKYIFVSGCDSGFGKHFAMRIDGKGFRVFAACYTLKGAQDLAAQCSDRLTTVQVDISCTESVREAAEIVKSKLPPGKGLWAVVNNAGYTGNLARSEMLSREDVLATLNVNLLGHMDVLKRFLPLLRRERGRVVNVCSVVGRVAAVHAAYCVSKYALEAYSDILRREMVRFGIRVIVIEPGYFKTPIVNAESAMERLTNSYNSLDEEVKKAYGVDYLASVKAKLRNGDNPDAYKQVVDAYVEAVTCRFPRSRYMVGRDAVWYFRPLSFSPDWLQDLVITPR